MRNLFVPIFLGCLSLLYCCHKLLIHPGIIHPFVIIAFPVAAGCFLLKKYKAAYVCIAIALTLLIAYRFVDEKERYTNTCNSFLSEAGVPTDETITLRGRLTQYPEIRREHSLLTLRVNSLEFHKRIIDTDIQVRIKVKGNLGSYYLGDLVSLHAGIYDSRYSRNFYDNSIEDYRLYNRIHFNGYCKSSQLVTLEKRANWFRRVLGDWRSKIRERVNEKYMSESGTLSKGGVFLQAILLGDRGRLEPGNKDQLLRAGVFHLLAISGAHIGIIALFCLLIMKWLNVSRKRYIITSLVLIVFLALSGFKISAERAVLMAVLLFIARYFYLEVDIFNIISFAGFCILALNPAQFADAGFILTFTLTAAIVVGRKLFIPLMEKWKFLHSYLQELLSANISAALIALPLSLYLFKRYTFAGVLSGLLLFPLTAVITAGGMLLIPLAPTSPILSRAVLALLDFPLQLFFLIVEFFSTRCAGLTIFRASPPLLLVMVMPATFFMLSLKTGKRVKSASAGILIIAVFFMTANLFPYSPDNLEIYYLDVGQGDAQLVVFPGGDALLVDGGGTYYSDFQVGRSLVLPFILQKRIRVKWVAVSHYHPDHSVGLSEIIDILKPAELWVSSEATADSFYDRLMKALPT
ncbi:MAG: DUF4131 domain-containing protein, partial [bacterium]|nr:DUF4131 domain-containing protein [bacterium]